MVLCAAASITVGCHGSDGPATPDAAAGNCPYSDLGATPQDLYDLCVAACSEVIGCSDIYDEDGEWLCEQSPGCRPGLTPAEAFREMFECEGRCGEHFFAAGHTNLCCAAAATALVSCFEALTCDAFVTNDALTAVDLACAEPLACLIGHACYQ